MKKIHLVKLKTTETAKKGKHHQVDLIDTLIFSTKAEKKISTVVSGQSLIVLLINSKVKSTTLKARFNSLVITFKQGDQQLIPMFATKNEWIGDLQEQRPAEGKQAHKKAKYVCLYLTSIQEFCVYLGYGSDCMVFKPNFDSDFHSYLVDINVEVDRFAADYEKQLSIEEKNDKDLFDA